MTRSDRTGTGLGAGLVILLVSALMAPPARAAEPDEAAARALFGEGRALVDAGRYADACLKFEESLRLDPGVGTSFNLADCQEHLGRTASAWARFVDVAAATKLAGQSERERVARARAAALEPKLARLVVAVSSSPDEGLVVLRDGLPVGASAWGIPVPVDPGPHLVEARAPGKKTWSQNAVVPDAPTTIVVSVPPLEKALSSNKPMLLPVAAASAQSEPAFLDKGPVAAPVVHRRFPAVVLGGLGVAGLATGIVFALRLRSENETAKGLCPESICPNADDKTRHDGLVNDAHRDRTVALVSSGIGAAALMFAAYFWWRPGQPPSTKTGANRFNIRPLAWLGSGSGSGLWSLAGDLEVAW